MKDLEEENDRLKRIVANLTIGMILCSNKDDTVVKYSVLNENKKPFASKYRLYLPTERELATEIEKEILRINNY